MALDLIKAQLVTGNQVECQNTDGAALTKNYVFDTFMDATVNVQVEAGKFCKLCPTSTAWS